MWIFLGVLSFGAFNRGRAEVTRGIEATAETQMRGVEREMAVFETALLGLATSPAIDRRDDPALYAQARELAGRIGVLNIVALRPDGAPVFNTAVPYGEALPAEPPTWFRQAMTARRTVLSDLFMGRVSQRPVVVLALPAMRDGQPALVLGATLDTATLAPFIREDAVDWYGAIIDGGGTIVARTRAPDRYVGRKATDRLRAAIRARDHGVIASVSLEGTDIMAAFSRSALYGWTFVVAVPRDMLEGRPRRTLVLSLGGGAGLFVLTALAAWLLWRSYATAERARERSRLLLRHASDGIHILDTRGTILEASDSFCRLHGRDRDEVIGRAIADLDPEMSMDNLLARAGTDDEAAVIAGRYRRKSGEAVDVEVTVSALDLPGWPVVFCSARDVTARKQAEAALIKANEDLEQFAYVSSHDLQTPLRNIVSYAQLLARRYRGRLDADADDFIGFIVDSSLRMNRLITDLLEYSRASGRSKPLKPVAAAEAVAQARQNLKAVLEEQSAIVTVGPLPWVFAETSLLVSLFQNLLHNGIKYRTPGRRPELDIAAEPAGRDQWLFTVADNGIGIDPLYHDKIFEIFQRLSPQSETEGTGIGLTLCRRIVHRFGGTIWVDSSPGDGTRIRFTLREAPAPRVVERERTAALAG